MLFGNNDGVFVGSMAIIMSALYQIVKWQAIIPIYYKNDQTLILEI